MTVPDLNALLQRWHGLTLRESAAIRGRDWVQVAECQRRKLALQTELNAAEGPADGEPHLSRLIRELMALERQNRECLERMIEAARREQAELRATERNLAKVRGSYGTLERSHWQSYS